MATVTHHIRSEYRPEVDKDRLLRETGQTTDDDPDPWQTESSSAGFHNSHRLANAPKFVPALLSYDEWGTAATPARAEPTHGASDSQHGDVAGWYRSLSRQGASPKEQQQERPPSHSNATRQEGPKATPEPSTSSTSSSPSIPRRASSSSPAFPAVATLSSSALPAPQRQHRSVGRDWFIARAISQSQSQSQSASAPPTPRPHTGSSSSNSVADILSRHPPSAQPFRPPVFLHLGPSNKGWAMLQNQGWSEGEGLGASSTSRGDDDAHTTMNEDKARKRKRTRTGMGLDRRPSPPSPSQEQATEEHQVLLVDDDDDDDPIIELRKKVHVPVIDLTQSDTEEEEEDEEDEDEDDDGSSDDAPVPPASTTTDHSTGTGTGTTPSDPRAAQTALLTPLPTILKSDRLGIGLKAKTEGPYRSSVKRVTHNAAALAAHLKAAEDMRRTQRQLGKGHRAFARAERIERERRQNMMAYLT